MSEHEDSVINQSLIEGVFPEELQLANIIQFLHKTATLNHHLVAKVVMLFYSYITGIISTYLLLAYIQIALYC